MIKFIQVPVCRIIKMIILADQHVLPTPEISRQGSFPICAPVKPYTELQLILSANCLPSRTLRLKGSFSIFIIAFALKNTFNIHKKAFYTSGR